jgi:ubiquitin-protein ligase
LFAVEMDEENMFNWRVWVEGPSETFYEGGLFCFRFSSLL